MVSCFKKSDNPFMSDYQTNFKVPPFELIKESHYRPAFIEGIKQKRDELKKIAESTETLTFDNTIGAIENSGVVLSRVSSVFFNLLSSNTSDSLQAIAKTFTPELSKLEDELYQNEKIFTKIKSLYQEKDKLGLTQEQVKLLDNYYKEFIRGGADLTKDKKEELSKINEELSVLTLNFNENILKDRNDFKLIIAQKEDLAGLPESVINRASEEAKESKNEGKWVFTLHKPSLIPFITYSSKRELREKIFKASIMVGDNNNKYDNKKILSKIVSLRVKKANLLGFPTYANFVLDRNMAKTPENVYKLLNKVWKGALPVVKEEVKEMQKLASKDGVKKVEAWDWWYYAEKVKKAKYDLDEEMLKPYFSLENVMKGAFSTAEKLYGIKIEEIKDLPKYHADVKTFEVKDADGSHLAIFYVDYYTRPSKRAGAWMNNFIEQKTGIRPMIVNVCNFAKPTATTPSLLSYDDVTTLFHEFGHALHGILSKCNYPSISGTAVSRDFVELPSQFMENWATEAEVLKFFAKHYKTGEVMSDELIKKIENSSHFNQGFVTIEYLSAALLDLDWHTLKTTELQDATKFETASMKKMGMIPEIVVRYRSTYFSHIFNGGYASGYYSYMWAEVLDADAFQAFKETSIFDQKTAKSFRINILEKGGTEDPMVLYKRFRGKDPLIEPLLKRRGLLR